MTTTQYTIKDVATRSGFTPATLRYYEDIGLLPGTIRTKAGYRLYDDQSVERLAFIARAKQLGCSLGEIADLATAWDGGACGPVQDKLRGVVAEKLARARGQIGELVTLTADLERAGAALEMHRPQGACDEQCGCVGEPVVNAESRPATAVALLPKPISRSDSTPIACSLDSESVQERFAEWQALLEHAEQREPIRDGIRLTFAPSTPTHELMRLAEAERNCCQFFEFAISIDARGLALEVRAPHDALPLVLSLFEGES